MWIKTGGDQRYPECLCTTNIITDLMEARWAKLLTNATFSGMSASWGNLGETVFTEENLYVTQHVANECIYRNATPVDFRSARSREAPWKPCTEFKDEADRERVRPMCEAMKPEPIVARYADRFKKRQRRRSTRSTAWYATWSSKQRSDTVQRKVVET